MPEIGAMLREARMRSRIDISEIETRTKIRVKYLRALEDEEWDQLPGPTFVKSFLRTYADALGLDSKLIVEEYKVRHERPSDFDLQPIRPPTAREQRRRAARARAIPPGWIVGGGILVALLALLWVLGTLGGSGGGKSKTTRRLGASGTTGATKAVAPVVTQPQSARVSLQLVPSAPVWVCLVTGTGTKLVNGVTLAPGSTQPVYRAKKFLMTLGNGMLQLRIDGQLRSVPNASNPLGYVLTKASGRRPLPAAQRPTCA